MLETLSAFLDTETGIIVLPAAIGASIAILTILIKDIFLHEIRRRRMDKRALVDRKLTQLYGPLYMVCVTGKSTISSVLMDDAIYEKLISNLHLLSPELQKLLNEFGDLGTGDFRNPQFSPERMKKALEISNQFTNRLDKEMSALREAYK